MRVIYKPTGQLGEIPDDKFDPNIFSPAEQSQPKTNWAAEALPATASLLGGVVGGVAGTALGPAGTVAGAALGSGIGGAGGEALAQIAKREKFSGGDIAREGALDTVTGLVGGAAGKGLSMIGSRLLPKITTGAAEHIMGGVFKEPIKATKASLSKGATLGAEALRRGEKGTTKQLYDKSIEQMNNYEDAIQSVVASSPKTIPIASIKKVVQPLISKYKKTGNNAAADALEQRLASIEGANGKSISASNAQEIKRGLYDEVNNAYGAQSTPGMEGVKAIARGFKESLEDIPGVKAINKELGFYGRQRKSMLDKMTRDERNNIIGLTDLPFVGGALIPGMQLPAIAAYGAKKLAGSTIGKTYGAQALKKAGELSQLPAIQLAGTTVAQTAGQGAARLSKSVFQEQSSANSPDEQQYNTQDNHMPYNSTDGTGSQAPAYISGYSPEQLGQAYMKAFQAGDKASAAQLKTMYDFEIAHQKNQGGANKPLPAAVKQRVDLSTAGLRAQGDALALFTKDPNVVLKGTFTGGLSSRQYDSAVSRAVEGLLRARSGAAVPKEEVIKYIRDYTPRIGDSKEVALYKLEQLRLDLNDALNNNSNVVSDNAQLPPITAGQ